MKIGAIYPQVELKHDSIVVKDYAQAVEDLGFSFISTYEHIVGGNPETPGWDKLFDYRTPFLEPFVLFSYMAGATRNIGFLTRTLILPQRQTALVAKQGATLDLICGGKLRLGVGIGWNELEYTAQGESFSNRADRLEEQVSILRELWTKPLVSYEGRWHRIPDVGINPLPLQSPIPIWFGGHSEATLRRVARMGDGWLPNDLPFERTKMFIEKLQIYITEANRHPAEIGIDVRLPYADGKPETWRTLLRDWKALGVTHISFDTMWCGFNNLESHLQALKSFAEVAQL